MPRPAEQLRSLLAHPATRGRDIDDPRTTELRRRIVRENAFLHAIYCEWYRHIASALPPGDAPVLELGSGAGFLEEFVPRLIRSEIFHTPGIDMVLDAHRLPFADGSLRGIAMTDVLHHLGDSRRFFREATRCVAPGGAVVMIEPWVSRWSRWAFTNLHHEPFDPAAPTWEFPATGPLSSANDALPWIIFHRDEALFRREFPLWSIERVRPFMPFRYIVSGGVSMRSLMPGWSFPLWRAFESALHPLMPNLAMFCLIVLRRGERG